MYKPRPISLSMLTGAFVIGLAGLAYATDNGVGDNTCPQWTTLKCTHWTLGPPPVCTETACVADKKSDPAKAQGTTSGGGKKPKFPIVSGVGTGLKLQNNTTVGSGQPAFHKKDCFGSKKCF